MSEEKVAFATKAEDREYLANPPQPNPEDPIPTVNKGSRRVNGVRYFAPYIPTDREVQVLIVSVAPTPEEAESVTVSTHGYEMQVKPTLLKGPIGTLLRDTLGMQPSLRSESMAYTVLCPWLLPKNNRYKPAKNLLPKLTKHLHETVARLQPKVIVAAGKVAFDALCAYKISFDDARGCWHDHNGTPLYLIDNLSGLLTKPWTTETLITDFREVNRMYEFRQGIPRELSIPNMRMQVIDTMEQLKDLVEVWRAGNFNEFSVDCEWGGDGWLDGRLRSIQFSWTEKDACYLRFFNENGEKFLGKGVAEGVGSVEAYIHPNQWVVEGEEYTDYLAVGEILKSYLDLPHVSYMAHHASADTPWMDKWLGLKVAGKVSFDSEFALQTADEYAPLGLDDIALRFTSFGRYDQDLVNWKRVHKLYPGDGYGKIPDSILIPYAMLDVLTVFQAKPKIIRMLERQDLWQYYKSHLNPFVTDTFHDWVVQGLPIDMVAFEKLRSFMNWSYARLHEDLIDALAKQANEFLLPYCSEGVIDLASELRDSGRPVEALTMLHSSSKEKIPDNLIEHWSVIRSFNIRSSPQMRNWLFNIMQFTPVKTTKGGESGLPQMLWDRVLELPEAMQKLAIPATDKETLEILSAKDQSGMLLRCLAVSNVGNQCKGFLKAGDVDETGEVVQEHGLAKYIGSDNHIHPNFSLTETTRPRTWQPNILNLSSSHNQGVATGLARVVEHMGVPSEYGILFSPDGIMPDMSAKDLIKHKMPTVRSIVTARPGYCFTESDWVTAEVRGLAFISGDPQLIKLITEKDPYFGFIMVGSEKVKVRIKWEDKSEIAAEHQDPKYLCSSWSEGKLIQAGTEADLLKDESGNILHPAFDLHWILAEIVNKKPRELLRDKIERTAAKVTRFSAVYGAVASTLERRIEALTGFKPEEGEGERLLEALNVSQPVAAQFLEEIADYPRRGIPLRSASGRLRRFPIHSSTLNGLPWRVKKAYLRSMGNEARNYFMQESVAATLSRACLGIRNFVKNNGLEGRPLIGLYDAVLTHNPMEERFIMQEIHQLFMQDINCWTYHKRWMNYPIDTDLVFRWSFKPSPEEKKLLYDPEYMRMPKHREDQVKGEIDRIRDTFYAVQPNIKARLNRV